MRLKSGTQLGSYEVLSLLGAGGMGEVYRARDVSLQRDVAIKVLPEQFAADPERAARFEREARVLASLNHPNIAAIYGLERAGDAVFLVLEMVPGETLADRIARGAVPLDEALLIARQTALALEAAHEKGIVHRDLKPANVKVTSEGLVKVLDFGLAKAVAAAEGIDEQSPSHALSMSPTITTPAATRAGVILGTAAYMSPEQARGKPVDKRADIWAFGCVLYEMLTGRRLFGGDEVSDTLAFVLTREPDWVALPPATPPAVRRLMRRCLEKDRTRRLADIADARLDVEEAQSASSADAVGVATAVPIARPAFRRALPWFIAGLATVVAAAVLVWPGTPRMAPSAEQPVRVTTEVGAEASLMTGQSTAGAAAVLSPDETTLAFVARPDRGGPTAPPLLHVRRLDQLRATVFSGTEGALSPFFSPDGRWIAFFASGKLKKVAVTGGVSVTLCDAPDPRGGAWADDDTIVFQPQGAGQSDAPLMRVPSAGGALEPFAVGAEGGAQLGVPRWPQALPGGRGVLYTVSSGSGQQFASAELVVQPLPNGERKVVYRGGHYGQYLTSGHLVFVREGTLFAAPFDLGRLETTSTPVPVLEGVLAGGNGSAQFSVSSTGTLVYQSGQDRDVATAPVHWLDRSGKMTPLWTRPSAWGTPRFAGDGKRLAVAIDDARQNIDIWVYEWERDTLTRLTFDPAVDTVPIWSPDGRYVVFGSQRSGVLNLYLQRADGTGEVRRLTEGTVPQLPNSWHPSGRFIVFHEGSGVADQQSLMILPMDPDETSGWKPGTPTVFVGGPFRKNVADFSPDGKWIAYVSNESGRTEVYVQPFPSAAGRWLVSSGGGSLPRWSRVRSELFYHTGAVDGGGAQIMVVPYSVEGGEFRAERPRLLSEGRFALRTPQATYAQYYDTHPDGERFAVAPLSTAQASAPANKVVFVFNFFDELRRLVPARGTSR